MQVADQAALALIGKGCTAEERIGSKGIVSETMVFGSADNLICATHSIIPSSDSFTSESDSDDECTTSIFASIRFIEILALNDLR
jgi:hypothetical protein